MTENEAIKELHGIRPRGGIIPQKRAEALDVAIQALEEIQRWHTSEVNPNIKNVFANTSTQICHNCDHKDEYIEELEFEIEQYRAIGTVEELQTIKERSFTAFELTLIAAGQMLLKEYRAIGTVEECKEAVKKLKEIER